VVSDTFAVSSIEEDAGRPGLARQSAGSDRRCYLNQNRSSAIAAALCQADQADRKTMVALDRYAVAGLDDRFKQLGSRAPRGQSFPLRRRPQRLAPAARGDRFRAVTGLT